MDEFSKAGRPAAEDPEATPIPDPAPPAQAEVWPRGPATDPGTAPEPVPPPDPVPPEMFPGWLRGLAIIVLTTVLFLAVAFALGVAAGLDLIPEAMRPVSVPPLGPAYYSAAWFEGFTHTNLRRAITGTTWVFVLALPMWLVFWLVWRWLWPRPLKPLIGPRRVVLRDFALISALGLPILAAEMVWVFSRSQIGPQNWVGLFPIQTALICLLLPLQTLIEEVIFRGFLQGWLIHRTGRAWLGIWLQAGVFAELHPGSVPVIFVLGLATGYAAQRSGALGASWAIHLWNNVFAVSLFFRPEIGGHILRGYEVPMIVGPQVVFLLLLPVFLRLRRRRAAAGPDPASD